jgi:hypothetical protein
MPGATSSNGSASPRAARVVAVTVSTKSPELLGQVGAIFRAWRGRLTDLFVQGGLEPKARREICSDLDRRE